MKYILAALLLLLILTEVSNAQTTAFSYQGSLNNSETPANGNHDFEFALFDTLGGANQIGTVKEQQTEIESLRKTNAEHEAHIRKQQAEIDALKKLICANNTGAEICRPLQ